MDLGGPSRSPGRHGSGAVGSDGACPKPWSAWIRTNEACCLPFRLLGRWLWVALGRLCAAHGFTGPLATLYGPPWSSLLAVHGSTCPLRVSSYYCTCPPVGSLALSLRSVAFSCVQLRSVDVSLPSFRPQGVEGVLSDPKCSTRLCGLESKPRGLLLFCDRPCGLESGFPAQGVLYPLCDFPCALGFDQLVFRHLDALGGFGRPISAEFSGSAGRFLQIFQRR